MPTPTNDDRRTEGKKNDVFTYIDPRRSGLEWQGCPTSDPTIVADTNRLRLIMKGGAYFTRRRERPWRQWLSPPTNTKIH